MALLSQTWLLDDPIQAADILRAGGIVAIPTETVYGLAARFDHPDGVRRIFEAKGRPSDNPLIVHVADIDWLPRIATDVPDLASRILSRFSPGPITVTVPRGQQVGDAVTAGLASVAVRIPDDLRMQAVLRSLDVPLVAPSANRSGRPSPTTWQSVQEELDGRIDGILIGPPTRIGIESTVVDCCSDPPVLLRPGGVTYEALLEIAPDLVLFQANKQDLQNVPSPGLRHRHYSPRCRVEIVESIGDAIPSRSSAAIGLQRHPAPNLFAWTEHFSSVDHYANQLFQAFRRADEDGLQTIFCQRVSYDGLGRGLMDRIQRAAE